MYETTIRGIGVATPPHTLPQAEARRFASHMFQGELEELERLLKIFENTEIERRALACPLEWYSAPHTFREANEIYLEVTPEDIVRAMKTAQNAKAVKLKLTKKFSPCLTFDIELVSVNISVDLMY